MVLDKSTLDALSCSDNPYIDVANMLRHIQRITKKDGVYLMISYASVNDRLKHLRREHLDFQIEIKLLEKEK